eukprot:296658-Rhodomonas_salina.2
MEAALVQAKEDLNEQLHGTGSVVSLPAADSHAMCLLCKFRIWCIVTNLAVVQHACCGSLVLTSVLSAQQMQGGVYSKLEEQAEVDQSIRALLDKALYSTDECYGAGSLWLAKRCPALMYAMAMSDESMERGMLQMKIVQEAELSKQREKRAAERVQVYTYLCLQYYHGGMRLRVSSSHTSTDMAVYTYAYLPDDTSTDMEGVVLPGCSERSDGGHEECAREAHGRAATTKAIRETQQQHTDDLERRQRSTAAVQGKQAALVCSITDSHRRDIDRVCREAGDWPYVPTPPIQQASTDIVSILPGTDMVCVLPGTSQLLSARVREGVGCDGGDGGAGGRGGAESREGGREHEGDRRQDRECDARAQGQGHTEQHFCPDSADDGPQDPTPPVRDQRGQGRRSRGRLLCAAVPWLEWLSDMHHGFWLIVVDVGRQESVSTLEGHCQVDSTLCFHACCAISGSELHEDDVRVLSSIVSREIFRFLTRRSEGIQTFMESSEAKVTKVRMFYVLSWHAPSFMLEAHLAELQELTEAAEKDLKQQLEAMAKQLENPAREPAAADKNNAEDAGKVEKMEEKLDKLEDLVSTMAEGIIPPERPLHLLFDARC